MDKAIHKQRQEENSYGFTKKENTNTSKETRCQKVTRSLRLARAARLFGLGKSLWSCGMPLHVLSLRKVSSRSRVESPGKLALPLIARGVCLVEGSWLLLPPDPLICTLISPPNLPYAVSVLNQPP